MLKDQKAINDIAQKAKVAIGDCFDSECKTSAILEAVSRYDLYIIPAGLEAIIERIRYAAIETIQNPIFVLSKEGGRAGDMYIINKGLSLMFCLAKATSILGEEGVKVLEAVVNEVGPTSSQYIDDMASLAAFLLSMDKLVRSSSLNPLKHAFQRAYGTGIKVALAFSIFMHEDSKQNRETIKSFLREYCGYDDVEIILRNISNESPQQIERTLLIELTFPGATGRLPNEVTRWWAGAAGLVILDIATNGLAFKGKGWKRKSE